MHRVDEKLPIKHNFMLLRTNHSTVTDRYNSIEKRGIKIFHTNKKSQINAKTN